MVLANQKIQQLRNLKDKHPNQEIIDRTLSQWQKMRGRLEQVSNNIYHRRGLCCL